MLPLSQIGMSNVDAWMTRMQSRRKPLYGAVAANGSYKIAWRKLTNHKISYTFVYQVSPISSNIIQ